MLQRRVRRVDDDGAVREGKAGGGGASCQWEIRPM